MNINDIISAALAYFFINFFDQFITYFSTTLADLMSISLEVLKIPLVQNGITYAQALAFALLVLKASNEAFQTYILYQNGDPDADPVGLIVRTGQAVAIIAVLPWLVQEIFTLGTKIAHDVAGLSTGKAGIEDWAFITQVAVGSKGMIPALFGLVIAGLFLVVAIQTTIRGAELALMAVLGPIMALNITANNRSIWSAWFRQVIIVCCSQALQIFMLSGSISLLTNRAISSSGLLLVFGWMWVTVKSPKYIQQFAYSTGLSSAIGGTAKQAGSMAVMRLVMRR
jgi:hypothetical protein